jgi:MFS family permease
MPHAPAASPVRAGAGAILALTIASATMFMIPYSTQAIVPEIGSSLDVGPAMTGLTITVVVIGIALGAWLMGPLSDRIGRREVMFGSCALLAVPTLLIAFASGIVELLILRSLQGLLLPGLLTVATAYVYEAFPAHRVPTVVGIYTSALVLGGFLGRTIPAVVVEQIGWRDALAVLAVPVLISAVLIRILLPVAPPPPKARSPLRALRAHLRNTPILLNAFAAGMTFFAFVGLFSVLAYRLESSVFGMSHTQVGAFYIVWLVGALAPFVGRDLLGVLRVHSLVDEPVARQAMHEQGEPIESARLRPQEQRDGAHAVRQDGADLGVHVGLGPDGVAVASSEEGAVVALEGLPLVARLDDHLVDLGGPGGRVEGQVVRLHAPLDGELLDLLP